MARWILFLATAFFGAAFVVGNWHRLLAWLIKRKGSSGVPILGGALLALAIAIAPGQSIRMLWWLPLVLDPGCLLLVVTTVIFWCRGGYSGEQPRRPTSRHS